MSITITIKDETAGGQIINQLPISFSSELVAVKEIIRQRIEADVAAYNEREPFRGLIQPGTVEAALNAGVSKTKRVIDAVKQYAIAIEAFKTNGYFVLIDSIQAEDPEQLVVINEQTQISFIKLTPLVGG